AFVNGNIQTLDAPPINRNDRTLLPVRFLANSFGIANKDIVWIAESKQARLFGDGVTIAITIGEPYMQVNGKRVDLDSPAIIENGRTYLPVRAIANALGVTNDHIAWDAATSTATLVK
ncbi:MAG: copper amine oxidase N-terminal domain-containing protein, partial [Clostridia bacterium]|nr:copper amine oxidase N-terminal domain-containing protein [Clostridia bacterium]